MSTPVLFDYEGREVRTVLIEGEPWWVAIDVCAVLEIGNPRQAVSYLDEDEVQRIPVITSDGSGRILDTNIISESGLYSLILRSRKPEARKFKRWITHEVIPAIRKTGRYDVRQLTHRDLAQMVIAEADRADAAEVKAAELETENTAHKRKITSDAPKVTYVETYVDARKDTTTFTVMAKQLGLRSAHQLYEELKALGVVYQRAQGRRRTSRGTWETVLQWLPRAGYEPWFRVLDQPEAPELHNGQKPTTLYVLPPGKVGIAEKLASKPEQPSNVTNLPARRDDDRPGGAA